MAYPDKTKEQMKELTDQLEQGVRNVFSSGQYEQYLQTMSQFHQYSFRNSMLIWMQRPDAKRVAGFNTWKNSFGRSVNKGEKAIRIFAPAPYKKRVEETHDQQGNPLRDENGKPTTVTKEITVPAFKPVPVFDVSQTSGRELPSLASELTANVDNYALLFDALKRVSPYPIAFEEMSGKKGYCNFTEQRIAIKQGMAEAQNIKTAIHEITHAQLHSNIDGVRDRQAEEIEAESTAFVVCKHLGLDTSDYSFGYVAAWSQDKELSKLQDSLDTIQKSAAALINDIDSQMKELTQQQAAEQPKPTFHLDAPFVPSIQIYSIADKSVSPHLSQYQVTEGDRAFDIFDEEEPDFFPVRTVDLETDEILTVGFSRNKESLFEANAYRECLFENGAVEVGTRNLSFPEHPGAWAIIETTQISGNTYYVAGQGHFDQLAAKNRQYMIIDQTGNVLIDQAFKEQPYWSNRDLRNLIGATLAEQATYQAQDRIRPKCQGKQLASSQRPVKPSIGDKLQQAKQSLANQTAVHKPAQRITSAEMEQ